MKQSAEFLMSIAADLSAALVVIGNVERKLGIDFFPAGWLLVSVWFATFFWATRKLWQDYKARKLAREWAAQSAWSRKLEEYRLLDVARARGHLINGGSRGEEYAAKTDLKLAKEVEAERERRVLKYEDDKLITAQADLIEHFTAAGHENFAYSALTPLGDFRASSQGDLNMRLIRLVDGYCLREELPAGVRTEMRRLAFAYANEHVPRPFSQ